MFNHTLFIFLLTITWVLYYSSVRTPQCSTLYIDSTLYIILHYTLFYYTLFYTSILIYLTCLLSTNQSRLNESIIKHWYICCLARSITRLTGILSDWFVYIIWLIDLKYYLIGSCVSTDDIQSQPSSTLTNANRARKTHLIV